MSHILLIDGDHLVHRYFHAFGPNGPEASISFAIDRYRRTLAPTHALLIFDGDGPTWRHLLWPGYKGNRGEHPEGLDELMRATAVQAKHWRLPSTTAPNDMEADDLIASYCAAETGRGWRVSIVSGDKDLAQLVRDDPPVRVHDEVRRVVWGPAEVETRFGVPPAWIPDLLALIGDDSDCYSGVPGIGEKTAVPLINEFQGFRKLMDRRNLVTRKSTYARLREHADTAETCYRLATLRRDLALPIPLPTLEWPGMQRSGRR